MFASYLFLAFAGAVSASCNSTTPLASATTTEGCACQELSTTYPEYLYYPNSTNYTTVNLEAWDKRSNLEPSCIFNPVTADQVADGMSVISKCNAQFAIRGGGHMNFPGANNINGGVMLALSGLDTIQISADNSTVEVGPGLRWFDVYSYLEPYGRIVIGGRLKTIGVPGLTLIGGVHYFANKYGYAMDNVVSYDVVLGNGTQVTATANSSSDLFWTLKGGANNFGVVTKFTLKTFAIPQVSSTIQVFNESGVQSFIKAACDLAEVDDASITAGAVITINYNATTKGVSASLIGVQEGTESPPSRFANFSSIPAVRVVNNVSSMATFAAQLDSPLQMFR
ncbi:FAD binding domain-containing protein [Rutstroemia sp. NJR-2017a WRK4]|nr:FAD binding domain-containing protein [Rutstroemia sp. NJR-2017a WRK4]